MILWIDEKHRVNFSHWKGEKINFLVLKQVYDIIESSYVDIIDLKA